MSRGISMDPADHCPDDDHECSDECASWDGDDCNCREEPDFDVGGYDDE